MRIGLFTYSTQPRGGVAHTIELGGALHDLGHEVVLHGLDVGGRGFFRAPRCRSRTIDVAPHRGGTLSLVERRIEEYVRALQSESLDFDVYHAHDGISGNALATLVERGTIERFVRTVHHVDDFSDPALDALQTRSIACASACYAVSDLWNRRVLERFGIAASRVANGVDTCRFRPLDAGGRAEARAAFGLRDAPLYLAIGGIEARKNTIGILEAFARVRAALPQAHLVIAGGASVLEHGAYREAFRARARALGLDTSTAVTELSVIADDEMPRLIAAADALVFPSLVEGFGLVVLEALASGVPVVTSAIAPFTEYLRHGEALLVDPNDVESIARGMLDAIALPANDDRERAVRELVARYGWSASACGHLERYREHREEAIYA